MGVIALFMACALTAAAQAESPEVRKFKPLAARIVDQRLNGLEEKETMQEQALAILDGFIIRRVSQADGPDLDAVNRALEDFVAQRPSVGENYRAYAVSGTPGLFVLVANFSIGGPAAIRLYAHERIGGSREFPVYRIEPALAGRIDSFTQPDFFDENVDFALLASPPGGTPAGRPTPGAEAKEGEVVFLTVSGRTDELQTGVFTVWRWNEKELKRVWESDLLQQSSYEIAGGGLSLTFCEETDEQRPRICRKMTREKYAWRRGAWQRREQADVPLAKP